MEREVSDCGWCQSAGSVWRGRCQICNVVVAEATALTTKKTTTRPTPKQKPTPKPGSSPSATATRAGTAKPA